MYDYRQVEFCLFACRRAFLVLPVLCRVCIRLSVDGFLRLRSVTSLQMFSSSPLSPRSLSNCNSLCRSDLELPTLHKSHLVLFVFPSWVNIPSYFCSIYLFCIMIVYVIFTSSEMAFLFKYTAFNDNNELLMLLLTSLFYDNWVKGYINVNERHHLNGSIVFPV